MCGSMVDIHFPTAENSQGKKKEEEERNSMKILWSALLHRATITRMWSEICCTRLAGNAGRKKVAKNRHLGTIAQKCRAISSQLRHLSTIGKKNLLSSNISSTCPDNMVNFGRLTAEIGSTIWGTPTNFNGFCVLAALLHGI